MQGSKTLENLLSNLKESFNKFVKGDKSHFILVVSKVSLGLLFFISLYLPFIIESTVPGGSASLAKFPGAIVYNLIILFSIPAYFYLVLAEKEKVAKKVLLVQLIIGTLAFLYGVLVYRVGFPSTATSGFGKHLAWFLLLVMWFTYVKENLTLSLIKKYITKDEVVEEE